MHFCSGYKAEAVGPDASPWKIFADQARKRCKKKKRKGKREKWRRKKKNCKEEEANLEMGWVKL